VDTSISQDNPAITVQSKRAGMDAHILCEWHQQLSCAYGS
jgi:hypothetical protein